MHRSSVIDERDQPPQERRNTVIIPRPVIGKMLNQSSVV